MQFTKWIYDKRDKDFKTCPKCKNEVYDPICDSSVEALRPEYRYCPYCGADNYSEEEASLWNNYVSSLLND